MPVFRVQVFYQFGNLGKWSNVWHVRQDDIPGVQAAFTGNAIEPLRSLLHPSCDLLRYLVSDLAGDEFLTTEINQAGTAGVGTDLLPLFCSVKVLFNDGGLGRPDLKYFKGLVQENDQANGVLTTGFRTTVDATVTGLLDDMAGALSPFVSRENGEYVAASVQSTVQMRQMHRRRKRLPSP